MKRTTAIRPACPDDLRDLFLLGESVFPELSGWEAPALAELLSAPGCLAFVALQRKKITGFIIGTVIPKYGESLSVIHWICVAEKQRGRGIGRMLCESFFSESRSRNRSRCSVEIQGEVRDAVHFFNKIGFTEKAPAVILEFNLKNSDS